MTGFRVLKFGGAALCDGARVREVVRIVRSEGGPRPVLVVSAHLGVTEALQSVLHAPATWRDRWNELRVRHRGLLSQLGLEGDLLDRHLFELRSLLEILGHGSGLDRERGDYVLSFGERMSARVVAAALRRQGLDATPVDAHDLGLVVEEREGHPLLRRETLARARTQLLTVPGIPVITGFLALDERGNLATLGRDGSDLSAVWIGRALRADEVQLWKAVPGLMSADPSQVPGAFSVREVSWEDAEALARFGSGFLHPACIEPAREVELSILLRSFVDSAAPGTRLGGSSPQAPFVALVHRGGLTRLELPDPDVRKRLATAFRQNGWSAIETDGPLLFVRRERHAAPPLEELAPPSIVPLVAERRALIALVGAGHVRPRSLPPGANPVPGDTRVTFVDASAAELGPVLQALHDELFPPTERAHRPGSVATPLSRLG